LRSLLRGASAKNSRFIKEDENRSVSFTLDIGADFEEVEENDDVNLSHRHGVTAGVYDQDSLATDERISEEFAGVEERYLVPSEIVCDPLEAGFVVSDCSIMRWFPYDFLLVVAPCEW